MNHFYQNIQGWFDFQDIYSDAVKNAKDGAVFVEVGSHRGKSAAYMAVEILNSGKDIELFCVDLWDDENIYNEFLKNMSRFKFVHPLRVDSCEPNIKADFVFIDADHEYESVNRDIKHWKKKAKVIGGHDYTDVWPGVKKAVQENFNGIKVIGNSWIGIIR